MSEPVDLAIIGAGPAGLAAAATAVELGLKTVVLDEQTEPGGQIYRAIESVTAKRSDHLDILGSDYAAGLELAQGFRASGAHYLPQRTVWQIDEERNVFASGPNGVEVIAAKRVLVAVGAMERPVPVPGWELPGVMTCGAVQNMLKGSSLVPEGRVMVVGLGPLLLLIAQQLARAGADVAAVLETAPLGNYAAAMTRLPQALMAPGYIAKGRAILAELRDRGVALRRGVADVRLTGDDRVREIEYRWRGRSRREPVDMALLHQGVVPNANLGMSLRIDHTWDAMQRCFTPNVDDWGNTSTEGILAAGDCSGIGGALVAEWRGRLAALDVARQLESIGAEERDNRAQPVRRDRDRHMLVRPFLDTLYKPRHDSLAPPDADTMVCRCEEVRAGEIRQLTTEQNCPGPNQMKTFVRCGMGPCQGRLCGLTVVELMAECRGVDVSEIGYYRIRPPVKPVTVGELATLEEIDAG
ncbi:MAG: FAD-dependent oxidoreductase [Rhodospirillales bacterium]|jgi:NADPH-dependent 2,4-dienoyl-CoA reductase/sulfur reductase-like enzyme|nr:FAD-dependent oxidoreductase [Rhodospirillales bacterium]